MLEKVGGKSTWSTNGNAYLTAIADLVDSKPEEEWLIIYHLSACGGKLPSQLKALIASKPERVKTVNWGAHQGRNDLGHISNVILAGTLFHWRK